MGTLHDYLATISSERRAEALAEFEAMPAPDDDLTIEELFQRQFRESADETVGL